MLNVTSLDGTASQAITVTVTGTNDGAVISGDVTGSVTEDVSPTVSGTLNVADVDTGEEAFQVPANLTGAYGSFTFKAATGAWTYTLDDRAQALTDGQTVEEVLNVTSLDGTATKAITVTVTGTNDGALISGDVTGSVTEDTKARPSPARSRLRMSIRARLSSRFRQTCPAPMAASPSIRRPARGPTLWMIALRR